MRILFIHSTPLSGSGGAEITLRSHLDATPAEVHVDVHEPMDDVALSPYDAVVLANLRPTGGMGEAAEAAPAIHWTKKLSGYRGFVLRSEHDLHPCGLRDASCVVLPDFQRVPCRCGTVISRAYEKLLRRCHAIRYLSPGHQSVIRSLIRIPCLEYVSPPQVDRTRFRSLVPWQDRRPVALLLGDAVRVAPDAADLARARGFPVETLPYMSIPYGEMPALLNRYQAVVVAPRMYHAFGRLAVEALACGCELIANDRVGALTFPDPLEASSRGNAQFWKIMTEKLAP